VRLDAVTHELLASGARRVVDLCGRGELLQALRGHPHRFAWTRHRSQNWCQGVSQRHRYGVHFFDIEPFHAYLGSSSQMARFSQTPKD
jgi:hypothetical protein